MATATLPTTGPTRLDVPSKPTVKERLDDLRYLGSVYAEVEIQFDKADYQPLMVQVNGLLEQVHAAYFREERGPSGEGWTPLSPVTIARKGHDTILFEKGPLSRSLSQKGQGIRRTTHRGLIFGTSDEKSIYHQEGGPNLPQRQHVGMNDATLDVIVEGVADWAVEQLKLRA